MDGVLTASIAEVTVPTATAAARRIAGVSAVGRIVRELAEAGFAAVWIDIADRASIGARAIEDVRRLAGPMAVHFAASPDETGVAAMPSNRLIPAETIAAYLAGENDHRTSIDLTARGATAEILRRTGKATDGPISRWINRPVSRALSAMLLTIPGFRPVHATVGTAVLALAMFGALVVGGDWGLIAGAVLFQAASVFDGVDGEVARATFRSSPAGAALDRTVDMATTFLFIIGLATNLVASGNQLAFPLATWSVGLIALGLVLIRWRAESTNLDRLKHHYRERFSGSHLARVLALLTIISSRDFFAFANAGMVLVGFPIGPLIGFAVSATVWILFVAGWVVLPRSPPHPAEHA